MTPSELIVRLATVRGAHPATLTTRTIPAMRKVGNPFTGSLFKLAVVNVMLGWHYAASVNIQRVREGNAGDFIARKRKWGERVGAFVLHKGRVYLETKIQRVIRHEYRTDAGELVPDEKVTPWLSASSNSSRQGVDREIILRDYAVDSIVEISFAGKHHVIETPTAAAA